MWFLQQLDPTSPLYNTYRTWQVRGALNVAALRKAFETIVARHEVLRGVIQVIDGKACQVTNKEWTFQLPCTDLREFASEDPDKVAKEIARHEAKMLFNLSKGPLFRVKLLRLDDEDHVLLVSMHHIITDGWSFGVLYREISILYQAFDGRGSSPLPDLPLQYGDYAVWQHESIAGIRLKKLLTYWSRQLSHLTPLQIPTDRIRPSMPTYKGGRQGFSIGKVLTAKLKGWYQQEGVTLFTALLTCFNVLLFRHSGQTDIVIGTMKHNRMYKEVEPLIGMFMNTLVLRSDLSSNPGFRELLQRVRNTCQGAYAHQELPFDRLVNELQPKQDISRNPLFQVAIVFQNTPGQLLELPGLAVSPLESSDLGPYQSWNDTSKFDLTLILRESDDEIQGMMEYSTDLFDRTTIQRMVGHFQALIEGVVADPDQRIGELPLLREAERQLMLVEWNSTEVIYPRNICIHHLFEAQVEQTPDAVALVFGEDTLTYDELNTRANHLAHYLHQQNGVGPEVCVGLCMDRSLDMVVGMLGILKAGGAYVPLDPAYPPARLAFILEDARVQVLLTRERLVESLPQLKGRVICVDTDPACFPSGRSNNPDSQATTGNVAYLIYTSGSTGQPKGVTIEHRSVVALLHWAKEVFGPEELRGVLASTSISFDLSVFELFVPLSWGGTVILAQSILDLPELPNAEEVTLINTVPSGLATLLRGTPLPASVRTVNLAGEPLRPHLVRETKKAGTVEKVYDLYGPSEDTTYSTKALREGEGPEIIGRPIDNTQSYLLDRDLEPVPIGVSGEVYLGGEGLARGYYNQPALTAERFIPHPFTHKHGARLYKTGDVARYLADGTIQYLGRVDHQVKVRGYRIELGEIEAILSQLAGIKEAVVVVREDEPGDKRVVAYVALEEKPLSSIDLRQFLKQTLPEYMMPAAFVVLDELPLTPNGKLDRRALPEPDGSLTGSFETFVPPRNPVEAVLVQIWEKLLRVKQVGVYDNFFELGGHSLLATQVVSQVYQAFEVELSLLMFFEAPTVAGIADFLTSAAAAGEAVARPKLVPVSREGTLPLSFAQERLWLLEQLDPDGTAYSMPAAFRLSGPLNVSALEQSFVRLLQRHEILRTCYAVVNEQPVQTIASGENFSLPVIDLDAHSPDEQESAVRQQIQEERNRPFDLAQGPLFRVSLLRLASEEYVLLLVLHHSIADGLSMNILYREVAAGYNATCYGEVVKQPPLPIQYVDYAVWQRQCLHGAALDSLLTYWTGQLAGAPPLLALPTDFPRPPIQTHRGADHFLLLPESVVSSLRALSQAEGVTMFMTLLATFVLLLSRYVGQEDIVVGAPVANRPRPELERMIGLFLNTLVLRTDLSGDPTFRELLQRVREVCLGAYAHQELPFERLVEELQPERDLSRSPLFQVFLNLVDTTDTTLTLPGLTVSPLPGAQETTKFDFTLYVFLTGEGATMQWSYNTDLFDASTIVWMADQFQTVLMHLHTTLDHPISSITLLQEEDRARLMAPSDPVSFPQPFVAFPETAVAQSIPTRFENQVHQRPDQLAVHTPQYQWTYEEVNRRANQIAHTLLSQRFPADTRVALLCAHDAPMVAAIFGVLKAGYAYVPLDPSFPLTRLETIVTDAGTQAVLAESTYLALAHELVAAAGQVLSIDEAFARANTTNPQHPVSPDNLAYVLYTSGTTGMPKGVMQSHRHVLHHIRVYTNNLHLQAEDRLTLLASYGFDAAVMDLFGALLNGATLYPFNLKEAEFATLSAWIEQHAITIYHSAPTVYRYWIDALQEEAILPALRLIVLGGEVATRADFEAYQRHFGPNCLFVNGLGPTESTVSLQFVADHTTKIIGQTVPVGHPVEHAEITLLSQDGKETEVYGEIAIRSPYVAIGYWQQPELTREVFDLPMEPGNARLYRTGDMGRRRYDGSLEFMGRKDTQVKIRGYRIELGEIEAVLRRQPVVREAVVLVRYESVEDGQLVAYVSNEAGHSFDQAGLRGSLQKILPGYMVPPVFVGVESFPLTPNGKIDRKALPAPEAADRTHGTRYVAPRNVAEELLVEVWQEVLKIDRIGIYDNFFELGGHSLSATKVIARLRTKLDLDIPLRSIFEYPVIAQLTLDIVAQLADIFPDSSGDGP